jgi:HipA-like protein
MARQPRYVPLNVYLNSRLVGQLRRDPAGAITFQYDTDWLAWPHTLPVSLSLPLREAAYTGTPVLAVFENLLPDNGELRRRIAARTQAEGSDAYSLLNAIGRDCVGALQFLLLTDNKVPSSIAVNSIVFRDGLGNMKDGIILEKPRSDRKLPKCQQIRMRMNHYFHSTDSGGLIATMFL